MNFYDSRKAVLSSRFSVLSEKMRRNTENRELRSSLIQFLQMAEAVGGGEHGYGYGSVVGHVDEDAGSY
jgi:hypothetical protein